MPAAVGTTPAPAATGATSPILGQGFGSPVGTTQPGTPNGGYNNAINSLNNALTSANGEYSGAQAGLQSQLAQNQGNVQQNLTNTGLGNSTVAQTMQQAPLQTYNQGMLNLANAQQQANTNIYGQEAGVYQGAAQTANQYQMQQAQLANALELSPGLISQNEMRLGQAAANMGPPNLGPGVMEM